MEKKYKIKRSGVVTVIELPDRSFSALNAALRELTQYDDIKNQKIFFMQSMEKENEPFKILIVFDF